MSVDEEVLREFLIESRENLDHLDTDLVVLEERPTDADVLARIFRTIHTIKGTCGFLGLGKLEGLAHVGESLLDLLRNNELRVNAAIASALLSMVDAIRVILDAIEATGSEGPSDVTAVVAELGRLRTPGEPIVDSACPHPATPPTALAPSPGSGSVAGAASGSEPAERERESAETKAGAATATATTTTTTTDSYVRVDVGLLDKLVNLVGELVLTRNQVLQSAPASREPGFLATSQRLNLITTELQCEVMKTRMQPIANVWDKLPRTVRDLALACGKRVQIEMEGKETELDRTIIESIKDPLTHLVRNCVDHGLETPEARVAAGKSAEGKLSLRAFHEGGQVNIEIADDGRGLDAARIRDKAVARGLVSAEQAARLPDRELYSLIFLPGFSTADKVSNISGRGVGMDVVKTNVERIGGVVDLHSVPGAGTTFRIKIPLTLAIIPGLIVSSGGERYAIPQLNLQELVRLDREQAVRKIETVHGAPVYRLRGQLLPLVWLDQALEVVPAKTAAEAAGASDATNIVVLNADGRQFGLVVDQINDTEEIVVKSLGAHLKGISVFSGATIMGDGRVALIIDVLGIAQRAHVIAAAHHDRRRASDPSTHDGADSDSRTLLLLATRSGRRMAVHLSTVARLEEFPAHKLEQGGDGPVVQYRGDLLPVVELAALTNDVGGGADSAPEKVQVVVYQQGTRSVGIQVHRILDVVQERVELKSPGTRPGMLGLAVIQQKTTELLDLRSLLGWDTSPAPADQIGGTAAGSAS